MKSRSYIPYSARQFLRSEDGGILIAWAVLIPVIVGMMGLGIETGQWYMEKRNLQSATDAAAIAAAYESTSANRTTAARNSLSNNGFGSSNVAVTVNNPPLTGNYKSNNNAVEVILSQPQTTLFSALFLSTKPTISTRSVALRTIVSNGTACMLSLDPTGNSDISNSGSATIVAPSCVVASNSASSTALTMNGGADMKVQSLYLLGNYKLNGGATLYTTNSPTVNATNPVSDPYANVPAPSIGACDYNSFSMNSGQTAVLNPGVYCNGFILNGGANATLNPGTYIIDRGSFTVNGDATLSGTGVTIIFTSSTGGSYATPQINGGANVTLSAPTSGTYSGIAFYGDRNAPSGNSAIFDGGATMNITGAIYLPQSAVSFNGGASTSNPSCTQVIGFTLSFNGNTDLTGSCTNSGMTAISIPSAGPVSLVE